MTNSATFARLSTVEEHVGMENEHNLDGIMGTFGETARYDDEPWGAHYLGRQEVRSFYAQLLRAIPDLHIDIQRRHPAEESIVSRGDHSGTAFGTLARACCDRS